MSRRQWVLGGAALAALTALPGAHGFAQRSTADPDGGAAVDRIALAEAIERARVEGRELLVFVIPEEINLAFPRGYELGAFLNFGAEDALAILGTLELACARRSDLLAHFTTLPEGDPIALRIRVSEVPQIAALVPAAPAEIPSEEEWNEEAAIDARLNLLSAMVTTAFARELAALTGQARLSALSRLDTSYRQHRIAGSHWARSGGCGVRIERDADEPPSSIRVSFGCGMGHVPERARRFLHFFVDRPTP